MRIHLSDPPLSTELTDESYAGRPIRQPDHRKSVLLTTLVGLVLLSILIAISMLYLTLAQRVGVMGFTEKEFAPSLGLLVVIALGIITHELLHALLHPGFGLTDSTELFLGWQKLRFAVYYEGRIPRRRWIFMRLFPLCVLTLLPLAIILVMFFRSTYGLETYLIALILVNTLGSGGDLVAVAIVLRQVPPDGVLNFHRGKAYWLSAAKGSVSTVHVT